MIKFEVAGSDIFKDIEKAIKTASNKETMKEMGNVAANLVRKRTKSGLNPDRHYFNEPYSKGYLSFKKNRLGSRYTGIIDLTLTGDMLKDLSVKQVRNKEVTVGFTESTFSYKKAIWNSKTRPFIGLKVSRDISEISDIFTASIHKALRVLDQK